MTMTRRDKLERLRTILKEAQTIVDTESMLELEAGETHGLIEQAAVRVAITVRHCADALDLEDESTKTIHCTTCHAQMTVPIEVEIGGYCIRCGMPGKWSINDYINEINHGIDAEQEMTCRTTHTQQAA